MSVFDRSLALSHVGDDEEILAQVLQMFLEQAPERLAQVEAALRDGDAKTLEREAHSLKGTAATLGMSALRDSAYTVERLGAAGSLDDAGAAVADLRSALDTIVVHLRSGGA